MSTLANQPAFPTLDSSVEADYGGGTQIHHTSIGGMTYRQWLAGLAMQGICADKGGAIVLADIAHWSVAIADTVIAELEKTGA